MCVFLVDLLQKAVRPSLFPSFFVVFGRDEEEGGRSAGNGGGPVGKMLHNLQKLQTA